MLALLSQAQGRARLWPPLFPPGAPPAGGHAATPATRLCPPGSHLSHRDNQCSLGLQQPPAAGLYTAPRHVTHPLPNSLAPSRTRQVNTAGVSSVVHTRPHPPPQLSIPRGQPWGCGSIGAGPAPQNGPRGGFWSPWPHSPAVSILPAAFLCKPGTCTVALHRGDDFGYTPSSWSTLICCCRLPAGPRGAANTRFNV